jgi:hypothetical protein
MNPCLQVAGTVAVEYLLPLEWRQEERFGERTAAGGVDATGDAGGTLEIISLSKSQASELAKSCVRRSRSSGPSAG